MIGRLGVRGTSNSRRSIFALGAGLAHRLSLVVAAKGGGGSVHWEEAGRHFPGLRTQCAPSEPSSHCSHASHASSSTNGSACPVSSMHRRTVSLSTHSPVTGTPQQPKVALPALQALQALPPVPWPPAPPVPAVPSPEPPSLLQPRCTPSVSAHTARSRRVAIPSRQRLSLRNPLSEALLFGRSVSRVTHSRSVARALAGSVLRAVAISQRRVAGARASRRLPHWEGGC